MCFEGKQRKNSVSISQQWGGGGEMILGWI